MTRQGYNERLFGNGLRKWIHLARFRWLANKFAQYNPRLDCVIELGCFDGRVLDFIPPPVCYHGYDANWEGGLDLARRRQNPTTEFHECHDPTMFANIESKATVFISLETLEHIPDYFLDEYLLKTSNVVDGYLFITVPNEKGVLFVLKHMAKMFMGDAERYTFKEFCAAAVGKMHDVERNQHKGFDWEALLEQLKAHFELLELSGVQFPRLPLWANFQIGMVFRSKQDQICVA